MRSKPIPETPHRWLVVCGSPSAGFAFYGPFDSKGAAAEFRDDWIAQGAESAEVANLYDPCCDGPEARAAEGSRVKDRNAHGLRMSDALRRRGVKR